jgi:hypothetical protein
VKKTLTALAAVAVLGVVAAPAGAASGVKYKGKTSSGLPMRFTLKHKRLYDMRAGIHVSCLPIQGTGSPQTGADNFSYNGWVKLSGKGKSFTFKRAVAFYYNEVTVKHTLTSKLNRRTKVITGTQRVQYEFLVPSYYPGTFTIYSCLGSGKFKAKPVKR